MRAARPIRTVGALLLSPSTRPLLAFARREDALAGALTVVVYVVALLHGVGWLEAAAAAVLCLPLAFRVRSPLLLLGVVACGMVAFLVVAEPSPGYLPALLVAVYTVAAHGSRWRTLALLTGLLPAAVVIVVVFSPDEGSDLRQILELVTQLGLAAAVGEAVRSQRAFIGATRERARLAAHEYELEAQRRVDDERMRIARDVHDIVAHNLATINTQAAVAVHVGQEDPESAFTALETIERVSTDALLDLRSALGALRDQSAGDPTRPAPSIRELGELVDGARTSGQSVVLRMEGSSESLPAALQVAVYRIVQEGLTNVMRHAAGARATVRVAVTTGHVEVDVSDDGAGAPTAASASGSRSGLIGMHERATALGGGFRAGREAGGGYGVHAVLPLERPPA